MNSLFVLSVALLGGLDVSLALLVALLVQALAPIPVVLAHALGRYAFAWLARLPVGRPELRVFVRLAGPDRSGARLGAVIAGTAAAYLAVAALAFAFATCRGLPTGTTSTVVDSVMDGFDAIGKLQPGDRIMAVDGEPLHAGHLPSLAERVNARAGAPVTLTVHRAGALRAVTIQPKLDGPWQDEARTVPAWRIGVRLKHVPELATDAATGIAFAIRFPIAQVCDVAGELVSPFAAADDEAEVAGPGRLADEFRRGFWPELVTPLVWLYALKAATFALLVLSIMDLASAAALVRARVRCRRAR